MLPGGENKILGMGNCSQDTRPLDWIGRRRVEIRHLGKAEGGGGGRQWVAHKHG